MALILPFAGERPEMAPDVFLAPNAVLVGNVRVGAGASIWFGAVLRGDHLENGIQVGPRSNIQDNAVVHVGAWQPTQVGADVTVGHGAKFESCTIEDRSVIGMNAVILQNACIGEGSLVAANSVVLEGRPRSHREAWWPGSRGGCERAFTARPPGSIREEQRPLRGAGRVLSRRRECTGYRCERCGAALPCLRRGPRGRAGSSPLPGMRASVRTGRTFRVRLTIYSPRPRKFAEYHEMRRSPQP